jgi:hypothetical protein
MLPEIGIMIGLYIITRCLSFLTRQEPFAEYWVVKIFCILTGLISLLIIFDLVIRSFQPSPQFPFPK